MRLDSALRGDHSLLYQSTIAPTGKTDECERERTEQVEMISKSFVMRCLNSGGTVHYRKSRSSTPQANQPSSVPKQSSATDQGKVAPPRQAARARLESYLNQDSK